MSSKYKYRVCGWRWRHRQSEWKTWNYERALPDWLEAFIKREPKKARRHWEVGRTYTRESR